MDRLVLLQLLLIIIAVPLQLFIATRWSDKNVQEAKTIPK